MQWLVNQDKGQCTQTGTQEVPSEHEEKLFHFEGGRAPEQAAQRHGGVFFSGDTHNLPRGNPVQPAVGEPAVVGGFD